MEIKTTKQICLDNEVSWYDGYHTKWVSVDDLIEVLSKLKSEAYIELLKELRK